MAWLYNSHRKLGSYRYAASHVILTAEESYRDSLMKLKW